MKRSAIVELALFIALLAVGVGLRLGLRQLPNFAPVAAIALFSGYFFRSWLVAASLPLLVMGVSDYFIGGYDGRMMVVIHATLALPVFCRGVLRRQCAFGEGHSTARYFAGVFGASLAASCLFFLTSNFVTWLWSSMYEQSLAGLTRCFINALPFFRYTLAGDLVFAVALFGSYAAAVAYGLIANRSVAPPATSLS